MGENITTPTAWTVSGEITQYSYANPYVSNQNYITPGPRFDDVKIYNKSH